MKPAVLETSQRPLCERTVSVAEPQPAGDFLRDILAQAGRSKSRKCYNEALDRYREDLDAAEAQTQTDGGR